jgi:hypothetical protein
MLLIVILSLTLNNFSIIFLCITKGIIETPWVNQHLCSYGQRTNNFNTLKWMMK